MWKRRRSGLIVPGGRRRFLIGAAAGIAAPLIVRPASAMLIVNQLAGFGGGGGTPPPLVLFTDHAYDLVDRASYSLSSISIGPASATRRIVFGVFAPTGGAVTPVFSAATVGGVACTKVATAASGVSASSLFVTNAAVPSGTTATIAFSAGSTVMRVGIGVWALYDLTMAPTSPIDTATSTASTASLNVDVAVGDLIIGWGGCHLNASGTTWTGLTERFDAYPGEGLSFTGGDHTAVAAETPRTVTCAFGAGSHHRSVAAVFR